MIFEDDIYGDPLAQYLETVRIPKTTRLVFGPTVLAYGFLAVTVGYHMLQYFDYPVLPISELAWNILVYLTPSKVISVLDPRMNSLNLGGPPGDRDTSSSRQHALKSEAIRRIIGLDAGGIMGKVHKAQNLPGVGRLLPGRKRNMDNGSPPGLGNWDNSCYQNSVIQGLASLQNLPSYLARSAFLKNSIPAAAALKTIITKLNDPSNFGLMFWTPAELKTMNSWQQQDAQEYFSKVLDEVGKEVAAGQIEMRSRAGGLASLSSWRELTTEVDHYSKIENTKSVNMNVSRSVRAIDQVPAEVKSALTRSPLEGLLAQRVGCLNCGYVEGLSLVPFNCLTVPLGNEWMYDIRACLDDYTALEPITGVECVKCTLLRNKLQLEKLFIQTRNSTQDSNATPLLTQALYASIKDRLSAVERALHVDDFSDNAILKKCQIPTNKRVSVTKSRQAVVARAPKSLIIHVNRSVFDEATGMQRKNFAEVKYPLELDLAPWCLGSQSAARKDKAEIVEEWNVDPSKSMHSLEVEDMVSAGIDSVSPSSQMLYSLRAVITHYGRHENGHYMCYRKHRLGGKLGAESTDENHEAWWCFNDEEVSIVSEDTVLDQGGVFMLFYERIESSKDGMLGSPKEHDPPLLPSSPKPAETSSEREEVALDDCMPTERVNTSHVTKVRKDTHIGATENVHTELLSAKYLTTHQSTENPEPSTIAEDVSDATSASPKTLSTSTSPPSTFQKPLEAPSSDYSTQEQPKAMLEDNSLDPSQESPLSASADSFRKQSLPEIHTSIESPLLDDSIPAESLDIKIFSTDETTKPISLEPGPDTAKPDDMPDNNPKHNHHHPMRTASPRSSRGSVSRAGKAMSNVSTMVIAN